MENEKVKVLLEFIKKQIKPDFNKMTVKVFKIHKNGLIKQYKISTDESDLIIEIYNNSLVIIKGNGLKKFEIKTNKNEELLLIRQGSNIQTINSKELSKKVMDSLKKLEEIENKLKEDNLIIEWYDVIVF